MQLLINAYFMLLIASPERFTYVNFFFYAAVISFGRELLWLRSSFQTYGRKRGKDAVG